MASLDQIQNVDNSANLINASHQGLADATTQQNNWLADQKRALYQQAGGMLANGDYSGGKNALFAGGDLDAGNTVQNWMNTAKDHELAQAARDHAIISNMAGSATSEPTWNKGLDAYESIGGNVAKYRAIQQKFGWQDAQNFANADLKDHGAALKAAQDNRQQSYKTIGQSALNSDEESWPEDLKTLAAQGHSVAGLEGEPGRKYAIARAGLAKTVFDADAKAKAEADKSVPISKVGPELTGDDVLKALPAGTAALVKKYANYELPLPGGFALSKPYWQNMMQLVSQYDPNFDAINYGARQKTRNDFTSGKSAQNVTSFNTAIGHLGDLDAAIDPLNNTGYTFVNRNLNAYQGASNPRVKSALNNFNASKQAVVDELTRAFRGSGGNVHDIKGWEESINAADSPEALHTSVKKAVELLRSRIESIGDQYNRGMGTTKDPIQLLSPKAQKTFAKLTGEDAPVVSGSARPPTGPAIEATAEHDGKHYVKRNGLWFEQ